MDIGQVAVLAEIPAVSLQVLDVQSHCGLHWVAEDRLGRADQGIQAPTIVETVFQVCIELLEFGVQLVVAGFGTHIDVVEKAVNQVAARVDFGFQDVCLRLATLGGISTERNGLQEVFLTRRINFGVQAIDAQCRGIAHLELQ